MSGAPQADQVELLLDYLRRSRGNPLGTAITFNDVTRFIRLQEELRSTTTRLDTAYEELQSTNEELETTNEELQSTNEELETTNEELQSSNEELETMNEELQSSNEELQTLNDELRISTDDLHQMNAFLESILGGMRSAVVVADPQFAVQIWNRKAEDLWGICGEEAHHRSLFALDIGLPLERLRDMIDACLAGKKPEPLSVDATNRRGKTIGCRVSCAPLVGPDDTNRGIILLMDEASA